MGAMESVFVENCMKRTTSLLILGLLLALLVWPAYAQSDPDGWTVYQLNMRTGPGTDYAVQATLDANTALVFEARSDDLTWLLGKTLDGTQRGWVASLYLSYREGFVGANLPVSGDVIVASAASHPADSEPATESEAIPAPDTSQVQGWTNYMLNMRTGPSVTHAMVATLDANTALVFEGRDATTAWVLARTEDSVQRGWLAVPYLRFNTGFAAANLPLSDEVIVLGTTDPTLDADVPAAASNPELAAFLHSVPVVPSISAHARAIFQGSGNYSNRYTKIGDCNSEAWDFMTPFDTGQYDLGEYAHLQGTVDFFAGSHSRSSAAAHVGFNALSMIDATWADPTQCNAGESAVWCTLRGNRPAVAVMMFGANDVYNVSVEQFDESVRRIVNWSIQNGTIPVLTTFSWCGGGQFGDKALLLNTRLVEIGQTYDIPVINFWKAAQSLPNCGMAPDGVHLSTVRPYGAYFTGQETEAGFALRNLVTLQTLDAIRAAALQ